MFPTMRLLLLGAFVSGAMAADPVNDAEGIAFFEAKIRPVLADKCYECHSAAKKVKAKLHLDSRAGLLEGGESGPSIIPGQPEKSLLIKAISYHDEDLEMPPKEQLSPEVVADFVAWVKRGAPDPRTQVVHAAKGVDYAAAKDHWAYRALTKPVVPVAQDTTWPRSPIDQFIRVAQERAQVTPAGPADRRVLLRRLSLDLLGLPPTPAEVDAFVADTSPQALERVVDRLLASPHFGERWARHWLDLARFAESHGYEQDYDRPFAWHYRDFVVKAFNDDLPWTTFTTWQLAGDEVAANDPWAVKATGFLAAGVWPTQITKNEVAKARYDALDDMLGTTFTAMLGTTVACARCHDHKLDPIRQRDYYRLLATFTTTVRTEIEQDATPVDHDKRMAAFRAAQEPLDAALKRYEEQELPAKFAAAEKSIDPTSFRWIVTVPEKPKSAGGATITPQDDGSLLISGKNPDHETLTFTLKTDLTGITGLRVEALAHPSLKKGGPGRADNGNFCLSDLTVTAKAASGGEAVPVTLTNPVSTFDQNGLGIAQAIDADGTSGWAVDPQFGKDHAAVLAFAQPIGFPGGTTLTVTMRFNNNLRHGMGRPRLSLTTGTVSLDGGSLTAAVADALRTPVADRSPAQQATLLAWWRPNDAEWKKLFDAAEAHRAKEPKRETVKVLIASEGLPAVRLHTQGADFFPETHFLRRGDPDQQMEVVTQSFWTQFVDGDPARWQIAPPSGARTSHRRAALARWMIDVDHGAGRLLARVAVNRVWQHLFGKGIVGTPSDFGLKGDAPTHPELLDWMASEFIAGGWRMKPLIRSLVLSAVYSQSGVATPVALAGDPQNRLLTRHRRHRLEAEAVRDTLLAISGLLDPTLGGAGTRDESSRRRSLYFTIKRSALIPFLTAFDFPEPLQGVAERPATTVAPQALALLNNPQARTWAEGFAKRISGAGDDAATVTAAWRIALGRDPSATERMDAVAYLGQQQQASGNRQRALADLCQVVMCLNEVIYVQ
jgi:hypothetical protein